MVSKIRWGIIGTGNIAKKFATGLQVCDDAELIAVGSRKQMTGDAFGEAFNVPRRHPSYEALANDPDVDVVYISTPHSLHHDNTILCLEAGKHVLCEKPFAINVRQGDEMIRVAREKKLFLMDAVWSRFQPAHMKLRELVGEGAIGEVRMVHSDFGFRTGGVDPKQRLFNPELGGGALLDVGVYNVQLASMLFGPPTQVKALAHLGETGVDEQAAVILAHKDGRLAVSSTAIRTKTMHEAIVYGTKGWITIDPPWWRTNGLTLTVHGKDPEHIDATMTGNGYNYEAEEVMACIRAGKLESDIMPLDETLSILRTLDAIRAQWGLKYPME
ncbi:MAG: dehydrogenase [Planctomycetes bacterium SM23_65]|nr:MAG: dehydrogenase [Planctomycetes bacterium SM23_65]